MEGEDGDTLAGEDWISVCGIAAEDLELLEGLVAFLRVEVVEFGVVAELVEEGVDGVELGCGRRSDGAENSNNDSGRAG